MNTKNLLLALFFLMFAGAAKAQESLPYFVNFNDDSNDGWQVFQKGDTFTGIVGAWQFNVSSFHEGTYGWNKSMVDDWVVSPALDLSTGASVAFRFQTDLTTLRGVPRNVPQPGDSFQLYLLTGSVDPSLATKTLLANIPIDGTYMPHDTTGILIPPVSGNAYIAFRYTTTTDSSFTALFTNFDVTQAPTGISQAHSTAHQLAIYPNPAKETLYWDASSVTEKQGAILNTLGQLQTTFSLSEGKLDIHSLAPGIYFLKAGNATTRFLKE